MQTNDNDNRNQQNRDNREQNSEESTRLVGQSTEDTETTNDSNHQFQDEFAGNNPNGDPREFQENGEEFQNQEDDLNGADHNKSQGTQDLSAQNSEQHQNRNRNDSNADHENR